MDLLSNKNENMNMLISQIIIYWKIARKTATQKLKLKINKR
jgi:hypothetical protein